MQLFKLLRNISYQNVFVIIIIFDRMEGGWDDAAGAKQDIAVPQ